MTVEQLNSKFLQMYGELKDRPDVLHTEINSSKKQCAFTMYLYSIKVELVYCWKWEVVAPPSVLYCRFYLNKNDDLFLHLPELIAHLGAEDYRACYFPYIENTQRMECCFRALLELVDTYIPPAEQLVQSGEADGMMRKWFGSNFFDEWNEYDPPLDYDNPEYRGAFASVNHRFESIMVGRHTDFEAYKSFLLGNWDKALKQYRKQKKHGLSAYEIGLCRFLEDPRNKGFLPMPAECFALPEYKAFMSAGKDLPGMALLWLLFSAVFCGILAGVNGVLAQGTLFHFGVPSWFGLVLGVLPALFGYYVFQRPILGWMRRAKDVEFYDITDHRPGLNKFAAGIFLLSLVGCLWFCVATPQICDRFYGSYAICTTDADAPVRFDYSEIEGIYYIRGRYNVYGDLVNRGSYVIALTDGTCIDLDGNLDLSQQEELIQSLFSEFAVMHLDSDRDLPQAP